MHKHPAARILPLVCLLTAYPAAAQISKSAYRALGQPDLRQNGVNLVQGLEMYNPSGVALDNRGGAVHLYVSDTQNHRILAWPDVRAFQIGDAPALILGQPGPQNSGALGIGAKGFNGPLGMAVDPSTGNLYVADVGNNRILRFPDPFANPSRVEPDMVYGQPTFNDNAASTSRSTMNRPRAVAFDNQGNLWVADTGNNRVLRFNAGILDGLNPEADLVLGQLDFISSAANRGSAAGVNASGFDTPAGVAFDSRNNLYVSDFNNARVLKFSAPVTAGAAAGVVFGQPDFTTRGVPAQASASTLGGPAGLCVDSSGNLYVSVPRDNRVLVFTSSTVVSGSAARDQLGQVDFTSTQANPSSFPYASASTFSAVSDIKLDADGNPIAADSGNNRVLLFPRGGKSATKVWGQLDFKANGANRIKPGSLNSPYKMVVDYSKAPFALYVSDTNNHRILVWRDAVRFRTGDLADLVIGQPDFDTALANVDTRGSANPSRTSLSSPRGIALDAGGNLYVADSGNNRVLRYPRPVDQSGRITPDLVIGQANFTSSISAAVSAFSLNTPAGIALDADGNLFVADSGNNRVLEFPPNGTAAIRVFGQPAFTSGTPSNISSAQTLTTPQGVFADASSTLYVADTGANRVMIFPNTRDAAQAGSAAAIVMGQPAFDSSAAGGGASGLRLPWDVAQDSAGNIYVSDDGNNRVLIYPSLIFLPLSGAAASAAVGQRDLSGSGPNFNATSRQATPEGLVTPLGIFVDRKDTLYVGDAGNSRVVHFLKPASVLHAANSQSGAPLALSGMAKILGEGLADNEEQSTAGGPLPQSLAGREVAVNDQLLAPLASVTKSEIDFQVPSASPVGTARVAVRDSQTNELIAGAAVPVAATSPGIFTDSTIAVNQGRILNQDGTPNSAKNAAARGAMVKIFGAGQGPVSPPVADGQVAPSDVLTVAVPTSDGVTCLSKQPSVCVAIGSTFGEIQFSGLAPQMVGVWQLTVKIPANAVTGDAVPLRAVINGSPSNIVTIAIK